MFKVIFCIIISYLLGNISGGMIFGKLLFNKDIRDYYLTKGNRGIHIVIIPEEQGVVITPNILRWIFIENRQSQSPAYVMAGTYETAALYDEIVKTNPKLKKVAAGLYQLVLDER